MTDHSPITPPPALVEQWLEQSLTSRELAAKAFQAGADQELEACVEWVINTRAYDMTPNSLRAARRPKPLSLRELALASVKRFEESGEFFSDQMRELEFIRKALEQLDD